MLNTSRFLTHVNLTRSDSYGDRLWMVNLSVEEPDVLMCARPGLREPWVSNHPGPPGPTRVRRIATTQFPRFSVHFWAKCAAKPESAAVGKTEVSFGLR